MPGNVIRDKHIGTNNFHSFRVSSVGGSEVYNPRVYNVLVHGFCVSLMASKSYEIIHIEHNSNEANGLTD